MSSSYYSISGCLFVFLVNKQFLQVLIGSIDIFDTLAHSTILKSRFEPNFGGGTFFFFMALCWTN